MGDENASMISANKKKSKPRGEPFPFFKVWISVYAPHVANDNLLAEAVLMRVPNSLFKLRFPLLPKRESFRPRESTTTASHETKQVFGYRIDEARPKPFKHQATPATTAQARRPEVWRWMPLETSVILALVDVCRKMLI